MEIQNMEIYKRGMNSTVVDKLFWTKQIFKPVSQLVDVGCADGTLLNVFHLISPDTELIGIDNNEKMLECVSDNIKTYSSLDGVEKLKPDSVLNLSSVLHEVYSYCSENDIDKFWDNVMCLEPEYIIIRDMYINENSVYAADCSALRIKILKSEYAEQLKEFEEKYGSTCFTGNMTHFLLKYKYKENWDRELEENYASWKYWDIYSKIKDKYIPIYNYKETSPYFVNSIKKDFGINFSYNTHIKLIFKKI